MPPSTRKQMSLEPGGVIEAVSPSSTAGKRNERLRTPTEPAAATDDEQSADATTPRPVPETVGTHKGPFSPRGTTTSTARRGRPRKSLPGGKPYVRKLLLPEIHKQQQQQQQKGQIRITAGSRLARVTGTDTAQDRPAGFLNRPATSEQVKFESQSQSPAKDDNADEATPRPAVKNQKRTRVARKSKAKQDQPDESESSAADSAASDIFETAPNANAGQQDEAVIEQFVDVEDAEEDVGSAFKEKHELAPIASTSKPQAEDATMTSAEEDDDQEIRAILIPSADQNQNQNQNKAGKTKTKSSPVHPSSTTIRKPGMTAGSRVGNGLVYRVKRPAQDENVGLELLPPSSDSDAGDEEADEERAALLRVRRKQQARGRDKGKGRQVRESAEAEDDARFTFDLTEDDEEGLETPRPKQSSSSRASNKKRRVKEADESERDDVPSSSSKPRIGKMKKAASVATTSDRSSPVPHSKYYQGRNESGRVFWDAAEDEALARGLLAYGPSWRKIMAAYGPNGTRGNALRLRTVVSCKDRAVNLRLAVLKSGEPIPTHLSSVKVPPSKLKKLGLTEDDTAANDDDDDDV